MSNTTPTNGIGTQQDGRPKLSQLQWAQLYAAALIESGIDITVIYDEWILIGLSLASLGEEGREIYHRVSSLHPKYDFAEADAKFTNLITTKKGKVSLGTFIKFCKDNDIKPQKKHFEQLGLTSFNGKGIQPPKVSKPEIQKTVPEEKWLYSVKDILGAPDQQTLWGFFTKGVNNALVASSEAGKSTLVLNLAIVIAMELETFMDWPLNTPKGRSVYVSTEDGISQIKHRLSLMLSGRTIPDDGILFILETHDLIVRLEETLSKTPADFLFIDTWGDLVQGKYDGEGTRQRLSEIKQVCLKYDCTPVYVHHTNKASENIPDKSSIKGAGDFEQACRVVVMLSIYENQRWLCCVKGNPFPEDSKNECYQLNFNLESQTIYRTGLKMPRTIIVERLKAEKIGRRETKIDWKKLLADKHLTRKALATLVMGTYGLGKTTAYERINSANLQTDKDDLFHN